MCMCEWVRKIVCCMPVASEGILLTLFVCMCVAKEEKIMILCYESRAFGHGGTMTKPEPSFFLPKSVGVGSAWVLHPKTRMITAANASFYESLCVSVFMWTCLLGEKFA